MDIREVVVNLGKFLILVLAALIILVGPIAIHVASWSGLIAYVISGVFLIAGAAHLDSLAVKLEEELKENSQTKQSSD